MSADGCFKTQAKEIIYGDIFGNMHWIGKESKGVMK